MAAGVQCEAVRVKPSKKQSRRRRRMRFAALAAKVAREEAIRGCGPTIAQTVDYQLLRGCGFDANSRDMRHREPPTRSTNGGPRLNRENAWHQPGDAKTLVQSREAAVWHWWLTLPDDSQDEVYELSAKCSDKGDGISHAEADPLELLRDMPKEKRSVVLEGEDARTWGRKG